MKKHSINPKTETIPFSLKLSSYPPMDVEHSSMSDQRDDLLHVLCRTSVRTVLEASLR